MCSTPTRLSCSATASAVVSELFTTIIISPGAWMDFISTREQNVGVSRAQAEAAWSAGMGDSIDRAEARSVYGSTLAGVGDAGRSAPVRLTRTGSSRPRQPDRARRARPARAVALA